MKNKSDVKYSFVVETDKYTGNFEREMCAYMTGHIASCEVGLDEQKEYFRIHDFWIEEIGEEIDSYGVFRPVTIEKGSASNNFNAIKIYLDVPLSSRSLEIMTSRAERYASENNIKIKKMYVKKEIIEVTTTILNDEVDL